MTKTELLALLREAEHRFVSHVMPEPNSGCWLWVGNSVTDNGRTRAKFWLGGRKHFAPRVAWMLANGAIPAGLVVCHKCDTPLCVNPDHLFLGTQADNLRDMFAKGRHDPWGNKKRALRACVEAMP